jgi:hypothetical protein
MAVFNSLPTKNSLGGVSRSTPTIFNSVPTKNIFGGVSRSQLLDIVSLYGV